MTHILLFSDLVLKDWFFTPFFCVGLLFTIFVGLIFFEWVSAQYLGTIPKSKFWNYFKFQATRKTFHWISKKIGFEISPIRTLSQPGIDLEKVLSYFFLATSTLLLFIFGWIAALSVLVTGGILWYFILKYVVQDGDDLSKQKMFAKREEGKVQWIVEGGSKKYPFYTMANRSLDADFNSIEKTGSNGYGRYHFRGREFISLFGTRKVFERNLQWRQFVIVEIEEGEEGKKKKVERELLSSRNESSRYHYLRLQNFGLEIGQADRDGFFIVTGINVQGEYINVDYPVFGTGNSFEDITERISGFARGYIGAESFDFLRSDLDDEAEKSTSDTERKERFLLQFSETLKDLSTFSAAQLKKRLTDPNVEKDDEGIEKYCYFRIKNIEIKYMRPGGSDAEEEQRLLRLKRTSQLEADAARNKGKAEADVLEMKGKADADNLLLLKKAEAEGDKLKNEVAVTFLEKTYNIKAKDKNTVQLAFAESIANLTTYAPGNGNIALTVPLTGNEEPASQTPTPQQTPVQAPAPATPQPTVQNSRQNQNNGGGRRNRNNSQKQKRRKK